MHRPSSTSSPPRPELVFRQDHSHWFQPLEWPDAPPHVWLSDPVIKKREAELEALLAQGPPERGTKLSPITWLFEPESFAPLAKLVAGHCQQVVPISANVSRNPAAAQNGMAGALFAAVYAAVS